MMSKKNGKSHTKLLEEEAECYCTKLLQTDQNGLERFVDSKRSAAVDRIDVDMPGTVRGTPVLSSSAIDTAPLLASKRAATSHRRPHVSGTQCSAQTLSQSYTAVHTAPPKKGHHFLHIDDFSKEELSAMLATARTVKDRVLHGANDYKPFAGKTMAMIFTKPSMRTRVSFETVSVDHAAVSMHEADIMRFFVRYIVPTHAIFMAGILQTRGTCNLPRT